MKVLFLNPEQYVGWEDEPSNHELRLPILNCGMVREHRDYCYQRVLKAAGRAVMDREILTLVEEFQPELVINSTTWPNQSVGSGLLHAIMGRGVPVYTQVWDTFLEPAPHELEWFYSCTCLGIASSISCFEKYWRRAEFGCGPRGVLFTTGHNVFTDQVRKVELPKRYDVTLLGSNEGQRTIFKKFLAGRLPGLGIFFHKLGGLIDWEKCQGASDRERLTDRWLPWDQYVEAINQSKVCVCAQTGKGRDQVKGKIFEFLACGAFVLADASAETRKLIPEGCLAYYEDIPDCLEKAAYFARNDAAREKIARSGYDWFHAHFDFRKFWATFLRSAVVGDVPLPSPPVQPCHRSAPSVPRKGEAHAEGRIQELLGAGYSRWRTSPVSAKIRKPTSLRSMLCAGCIRRTRPPRLSWNSRPARAPGTPLAPRNSRHDSGEPTSSHG